MKERLGTRNRSVVLWEWDRPRDTEVPRQHAISWTERDGHRSGCIYVTSGRSDPEDPLDPIIDMELQVQLALAFSEPIVIRHL